MASLFQLNNDAETMMSGGELGGPGRSIVIAIPIVFRIFSLVFCEVFGGQVQHDAFAGK